MAKYNATVLRLDPVTGAELSCFVAEVDEQGRMLRSNAFQFTGLEGSPRYDGYLRRCGHQFRIVKDDCLGYRQRLLGLQLPPGYGR